MTETLYIIDVATYGNIIKLFLSKTKNKDIWGDDWNDAPYEHNAGEVYLLRRKAPTSRTAWDERSES